MAWWKNGLLLATGGAIGLIAGALLYEAVMEDGLYDDDDEPERDGIKLLADKIRREATDAMEVCRTDEERKAVYEQIRKTVRSMQEKIAKTGDKIIADLQKQALAAVEEAEENAPENRVRHIKETMQELADSLDETLDSLKPTLASAV